MVEVVVALVLGLLVDFVFLGFLVLLGFTVVVTAAVVVITMGFGHGPFVIFMSSIARSLL